ncbi:MAG: tRNA pseudouridine(38-40) synthase TruA [candidate division Zixibacteria bacterium]|nr:tRNA pseudouridine(38-40) synthase TruA [candidate division Zixibacteria bacterium]
MADRNIRLVIEYSGTGYAGWQIQAVERTIQGELTEAILRTTGKKVKLTGAGRTDAGVHALGQVANFRIDHNIEPERYRDALNYYLADDIRVKKSVEVPLDFNARRDALWKRYRYLIGNERSALHRQLRWEYVRDLDYARLQKAAELVTGEHDFSAFCVVASLKEDNRCLIHVARWRKIGPLLVFEVRGNRFLHNMVRILVGAMVNLATVYPDNHRENLTLEGFADILHTPTAQRVVFTAPPQGLYLVTVKY